MAIDPDLYEKYSGRRIGEAQDRMARSLAERDVQRAKDAERSDAPRVPMFLGMQGLLIHMLIYRLGWPGLIVLLIVAVLVVVFSIR